MPTATEWQDDMTNRYDIVASKKDRDGKMRYTKIGAMFPSKNGEGFSITLDALPLPNEKGECWLGAFVPRERDDAPASRQASRNSTPRIGNLADAIDDNIPF